MIVSSPPHPSSGLGYNLASPAQQSLGDRESPQRPGQMSEDERPLG